MQLFSDSQVLSVSCPTCLHLIYPFPPGSFGERSCPSQDLKPTESLKDWHMTKHVCNFFCIEECGMMVQQPFEGKQPQWKFNRISMKAVMQTLVL